MSIYSIKDPERHGRRHVMLAGRQGGGFTMEKACKVGQAWEKLKGNGALSVIGASRHGHVW